MCRYNHPLGCAQKPWRTRMAASLLLRRQWILLVSVCECVACERDQLTWIPWIALCGQDWPRLSLSYVCFSPSFVGWCGNSSGTVMMNQWILGRSLTWLTTNRCITQKARLKNWMPSEVSAMLWHVCRPGFSMTVSCLVVAMLRMCLQQFCSVKDCFFGHVFNCCVSSNDLKLSCNSRATDS